MTLPNALSWSRIWAAFILPIIFFFSQPSPPESFTISGSAGAVLVILVFLTDWADGYLARIRNQQTVFGAKLDHTADKILASSLSLYFCFVEPALPLVLVLFLLFREWGIALLRIQANIPVKCLGKIKLAIEGAAFALLAGSFYTVGAYLYLAATVLAYWSAYFYIRQAFVKAA